VSDFFTLDEDPRSGTRFGKSMKFLYFLISGSFPICRQKLHKHEFGREHAQCRFVDVSKGLPAGKHRRAHEVLVLIGKLYAIEKNTRKLKATEWLALRQGRSRAVINELRCCRDQVLPTVPPSSVLGGALGDLHRQWPRPTRYLERGDLPIDNNPAETPRPFVVGRKGSSRNPACARQPYLLAGRNGPQQRVSVLRRTAPCLPTTVEHFEALLPWNLKAEQLITYGVRILHKQ
jgi:transposase